MDEYKTIRFIDRAGFSQEPRGEFMQVDRTTVQQVYANTRKKRADVLADGLPLRIEGGDYPLCWGGSRIAPAAALGSSCSIPTPYRLYTEFGISPDRPAPAGEPLSDHQAGFIALADPLQRLAGAQGVSNNLHLALKTLQFLFQCGIRPRADRQNDIIQPF